MGILRLPGLVQTVQPQSGPTLIDRANQLGRRVIESMTLGSSYGALGTKLTLGSGGSLAPSPKGISLRGSGAAARASFPLDLSGKAKVSFAFWLYWDAYANDDRLAFEFTTNGSPSGSGGFALDPNSNGAPGRMEVFGAYTGGAATFSVNFPRPSAAVLHRCVLSFDGTGAGVSLFVDGVAISGTVGLTGGAGTSFANSTMYLLSRAGTALYGLGNLQDFTIFDGAFNAADALADFQNPYQIFRSPQRVMLVAAAGPNITLALTGQSIAAASGILIPGSITTLSGQSAAAASGSIAPSIAVTPVGLASSAQQGLLTPARSIAISGQGAATSAGTVSPGVAAALIGQSSATQQGVVSPSGNITVALTGQSVSVAQGALTRATQEAVFELATIMRQSAIAVQGGTMKSTVAAQGGTIKATLALSTIMRQSQINTKATMTNASINRTVAFI